MAGIRDLEAVVTRTVAAGGRVLLVGDHRQLPEVDRRRRVRRRSPTDPRVDRRRAHRQPPPAPRRGNATPSSSCATATSPTAVAAYRDHDRVVVADDRAAMLAAAVDRWFDAHDDGPSPVLLAGTNDTVDALNRAVRHAPRSTAALARPAPSGTSAGRDSRSGNGSCCASTTTTAATIDRRTSVGAQRPDRHRHRRRPTPGSSSASTTTHAEIAPRRRLPRRRRRRPRLRAHRPPRPGRHLGPRHRRRRRRPLPRSRLPRPVPRPRRELADRSPPPNSTPSTPSSTATTARIPLPGEEPDVDEDLTRRLNRSRAKLLALTRDPHADADRHTAATHRPRRPRRRGPRTPRQSSSRPPRSSASTPTDAATRLDRAEHTATHVAVGQTVKAYDRHNIGTIVGLDDTAGAVRVALRRHRRARRATRDMRWDDVSDRRTPPARSPAPHPGSRERPSTGSTAAARQRLDRWHAHPRRPRRRTRRPPRLRTRRPPRHRPRRRPPRRRPARLAHRRCSAPDPPTPRRRAGVGRHRPRPRRPPGPPPHHRPHTPPGPDHRRDAAGRVGPRFADGRRRRGSGSTPTPPARPSRPPAPGRRPSSTTAATSSTPSSPPRPPITVASSTSSKPAARSRSTTSPSSSPTRSPPKANDADGSSSTGPTSSSTPRSPTPSTEVSPAPTSRRSRRTRRLDRTRTSRAPPATASRGWSPSPPTSSRPTRRRSTRPPSSSSATSPATGTAGTSPARGPLGDAATDLDQAAERALLAIAIDHAIGEESVALEDPWGVDRLDHARHSRLPALDDSLGW